MFFSKPKNTSEIKKVLTQLPDICFLQIVTIKDFTKNEPNFKNISSDFSKALSLGYYLFYCVLVMQAIGIIKDKKVVKDVQEHMYSCFFNLNVLSRVGVDKNSFDFFVEMYTAMYDKSNQTSSTDVMKFLSTICVEFISNELGMNLNSKQVSLLAPLIAVVSKDGFAGLVAESMNLNL
jgi:hypothetical protein